MRNRDIEKEMTSRAEFDLIHSIKPHKHIIQSKEFISTVSNTYTVMECAEGTELQAYLKKEQEEPFPSKSQL